MIEHLQSYPISSVPQTVRPSPPTSGVPTSRVGHSTWVSSWTKWSLDRFFSWFLPFSSSSSLALQPWSSLGLLKNVLSLVPINCLILPDPDTHGFQIPLNTVQPSGLWSSHFTPSFRICQEDTLYWIIWVHPGHITCTS